MGIDSLRNFSLDEGLDNRDLIGKYASILFFSIGGGKARVTAPSGA